MEEKLRQALVISRAIQTFIDRPLSATLLVLALVWW